MKLQFKIICKNELLKCFTLFSALSNPVFFIITEGKLTGFSHWFISLGSVSLTMQASRVSLYYNRLE